LPKKVTNSIFHAPPELHEYDNVKRQSSSRYGENGIGGDVHTVFPTGIALFFIALSVNSMAVRHLVIA
jgi:hypothetical protein